jgi:hypothetical protein
VSLLVCHALYSSLRKTVRRVRCPALAALLAGDRGLLCSYWATAPLTISLTADVYGLKTLGTLNGVAFLIHQVAAAISIQFAELMRDLTGSYTLPFTIAGLLLLPAALSAFSIREKQYSVREQNRSTTTHA